MVKIGDKVRVYDTGFSGSRSGIYFEGIVTGFCPIFPYLFNYLIERVFLLAGEAPHSWKVGTTGQVNIKYADEVLELL